MYYLLTTSISAAVVQNGLFNYLGKNKCKSKGDSYFFNAISYITCIIIFAILTYFEKASLFSLGIGLLYGFMTAISCNYKMLALGEGSLHITTLIVTASMIIPTMSGFIFFGEAFSLIKLIGIIFLLFFVYLSLNKDKTTEKINSRWLIYCAICFISTGMIGILQKIHQGSVYKTETGAFLLSGFICSLIYSFAMSKKYKRTLNLSTANCVFAAIIGLCTFANHYLNLKLSGIVPAQLFFPLVNAGPMILTIIISVVIFKEKITKMQMIGIVGSILSLACICLFN